MADGQTNSWTSSNSILQYLELTHTIKILQNYFKCWPNVSRRLNLSSLSPILSWCLSPTHYHDELCWLNIHPVHIKISSKLNWTSLNDGPNGRKLIINGTTPSTPRTVDGLKRCQATAHDWSKSKMWMELVRICLFHNDKLCFIK